MYTKNSVAFNRISAPVEYLPTEADPLFEQSFVLDVLSTSIQFNLFWNKLSGAFDCATRIQVDDQFMSNRYTQSLIFKIVLEEEEKVEESNCASSLKEIISKEEFLKKLDTNKYLFVQLRDKQPWGILSQETHLLGKGEIDRERVKELCQERFKRLCENNFLF